MSTERTPPAEELRGWLVTAHERLCKAQAHVVDKRNVPVLQEALSAIERVGVLECPDWSKWREPPIESEPA